MTSKIRHDVKRQNTSWYKKITMTSKIRKKYVMTIDLFPEYFLTTIDPQLTNCDIGLWTHIYAQHKHRQTHKHQLFNSIACEIKDRHIHTNASITITSLYWWISSSVLTNSCINGEIWSYLLFEIMVSSYCIVFRGVHKCKTVTALNINHGLYFSNPGSYKPGLVHCSKIQTKPHQNRGSDQVYTDQVSAWFKPRFRPLLKNRPIYVIMRHDKIAFLTHW